MMTIWNIVWDRYPAAFAGSFPTVCIMWPPHVLLFFRSYPGCSAGGFAVARPDPPRPASMAGEALSTWTALGCPPPQKILPVGAAVIVITGRSALFSVACVPVAWLTTSQRFSNCRTRDV